MVRWILAVLTLLVFSLGGIAVLAVLLWWLLRRQKEEETAPRLEIDAQPSTLDAGPGEALVEPGLSAPELELPATEAPEEQPEEDVLVPEAEEGERAADIATEAETRLDEAVPPLADKLERIYGIGPKIASVLRAAGITTFASLAATDVSRLEEVLEAESPRLRRLADPATWPEQARLAAAGDWDGLEALHRTLRGGRSS
jgi:predicted flap endonuclease-1-like 5' DNA nuclease